MFTKFGRKVSIVLTACMLMAVCVSSGAVAEGQVISITPGSGKQVETPVESPKTETNPAPVQQQPAAPVVDQPPLVVETTDEEPFVEGTPEPGMYRVTFYNLSGAVVGWTDVQEGSHLLELEGYPHVDGLVFQYWYDISNEIPEPYEFGLPVMAHINLVPFYTIAEEGSGNDSGNAAMSEEEIANLISQILTTIPAEEEPSGLTGDKIGQIIDEITGVVETPEGEAGDVTHVTVEDVFGEPSLGEEQVNDLIQDILNTGEPAVEDEVTVTEPLPIELSQPEDFFEIADSEPPLSGPELDPMVLVTCMFDGDAIEVGTVVTLSAELINFPQNAVIEYQWQNNASGLFANVPDATGRTHTFVSDGFNSNCVWQVETVHWTEAE